MYVTKDMLLAELPPVRDEWVVVHPDQRVKDIIHELCESYPVFAGDYDKIGCYFEGATLRDTCDNLYDWCKDNLSYNEETEHYQTTALPGGLITRGFCDCKGYASFIGGCLGAIGRANGKLIDWYFCFASYLKDEPIPYHVFIVVNTDEGQIWVDPTPGANDKEPKHAIMQKPLEPAASTVGSTSYVAPDGRIFFDGKKIGKNTSTTDTVTAVSTFATDALSGNIVGAVKSILPLIQTWLANYTYTGGDYALGEIFLNRVMNKATTSRWDTPDEVVPIAWMYFTTLFGIPIAVNTDFDNIETGTLDAYLQGRPEQRGHVTQAQVTRAKQLLDMLGHSSQTVPQWPPTDFGLLPYVGPIPDPRIVGALYNGQLPNGQQVQNGIPVSAATGGANAQVPGASPLSTASTSTIGWALGIAALAAIVWYYWEN